MSKVDEIAKMDLFEISYGHEKSVKNLYLFKNKKQCLPITLELLARNQYDQIIEFTATELYELIHLIKVDSLGNETGEIAKGSNSSDWRWNHFSSKFLHDNSKTKLFSGRTTLEELPDDEYLKDSITHFSGDGENDLPVFSIDPTSGAVKYTFGLTAGAECRNETFAVRLGAYRTSQRPYNSMINVEPVTLDYANISWADFDSVRIFGKVDTNRAYNQYFRPKYMNATPISLASVTPEIYPSPIYWDSGEEWNTEASFSYGTVPGTSQTLLVEMGPWSYGFSSDLIMGSVFEFTKKDKDTIIEPREGYLCIVTVLIKTNVHLFYKQGYRIGTKLKDEFAVYDIYGNVHDVTYKYENNYRDIKVIAR